jgi:poly(glycerol-phosphate) alpha-glucosyltransferase
MHSNHRGTPYGPDAPTKPHFQALIDAAEHWDAFVVLTSQQRDDIVAAHDPQTEFRVINNLHDAEPLTVAEDADDPLRFVMAARIAPFKRIDLAVMVMAAVVEKLPDARLDFYGYGMGDELEEKVRSLVVEHGLEEHFRFVGFASSPADIFVGAAATVMTSVSEAFPLILLESMSYGTPVLSFDTLYGPAEVIRDGENGFLVPVGDIDGLAARIVEVAQDTELRRRLRSGAAATPARFNRTEYVRRWVELVDAVEPPPLPLWLRARRRLGRLRRRLRG